MVKVSFYEESAVDNALLKFAVIIAKTDELVDSWTYPEIQPKLLEEAHRRGFV